MLRLKSPPVSSRTRALHITSVAMLEMSMIVQCCPVEGFGSGIGSEKNDISFAGPLVQHVRALCFSVQISQEYLKLLWKQSTPATDCRIVMGDVNREAEKLIENGQV